MLCCSGGGCEGLQVEEVTTWFGTVSASLVWALCISDSGVRPQSCTERSLCVLTDVECEDDSAGCVCG